MTPTTLGRHCAVCATEVVDFTRMSEAEVLAFLAVRRGRSVCAFVTAPVVLPRHPKRIIGFRRWVLAAVAFVSGQQVSALGLPPQALPVPPWQQGVPPAVVVIRGLVLDDSLNEPVRGADIYVGNTKYGTTANERGEFVLTLPTDWEPLKSGTVKLRSRRVPFALLEETVEVSVKGNLAQTPLTIRMLSSPDRGHKGKVLQEPAPVPLPQGTQKRK
jgi:hypothetical protein